ncbi:MAG TPA: SDR family NAD(P)-dependent oxidoreductase [Candidatus Acidoferrales bacterium]|nr:SDR family NAD(P)-dependent oxidoreductase [Candidatus Acidoferrales bacterium]
MRTEGKVVLITGGSEGVGAACAAEFARSGARVSLVARNEAGLRRAGGPDALITAGDITLEDTRRRAVTATLERYGAIDILINNAAVGLYQPSWEMPVEEARYLMELNLFAPLALTQLVIPHMRERRSGMIVNVGSIAGKVVLPWLTFYSVTKFALGALTEGQRMELRRDGIQTMLVCPGYVKTNFQKNVRAGQAPEKVLQSRAYAITPEQCAAAIRRGVERDARTVVTPRAGWLIVLAMRLFPAFVESRMAGLNGTA